MMLANVPSVFLGDTIVKKVSMKLGHGIAAVIFAALGLLTLLNLGSLFWGAADAHLPSGRAALRPCGQGS